MIVAAHQPNHLPWLGYFDRMQKADLFILVDHVQFERQNYQNRTRIKTGDGASRWLTVPVFQRSQQETIVDKMVDNQRDGRLRWGRKHYLSIEYSYRAAPYFDHYGPALKETFNLRWERLVDLNLQLIQFLRGQLGIHTPMMRSSELGIVGAKSEMVLQLCLAVGATAYLAGTGGSRDYLDVAAFKRAGIEILWQEFSHPRYIQYPSPRSFIEGLSALDLLMNCGPESAQVLRDQASQTAIQLREAFPADGVPLPGPDRYREAIQTRRAT